MHLVRSWPMSAKHRGMVSVTSSPRINRSSMTLPLKTVSLAERLNSSKEREDDEQGNASAIHAGIQA